MKICPIATRQNPGGEIDLNVLCITDAQINDRWRGENYPLPVNRLYLVEEGGGMLDTGQGEIRMEPGMAYLVPAGAPLRYRCDAYMKKIYLHFNLFGPDRYDLMEGFPHVGVVPLPPELPEKLRFHGSRRSAEDILRLRQLLYELLGLFLSQYDLSKKMLPNYSEHVQSTITYIQENLSAGLRVEDLAKRLFISRSSLATKFRSEVGVSIGKYIDDQLMTAALLRVGRTHDSIQDISRELGFADQCYFARRFKQFHGVTPTEHRRRKQI